MKCPKCQTDNPDTSRFCCQCAAVLADAQVEIPTFTATLETPTQNLTSGATFAERYQIIEELGRGGMGNVYKALDKEIDAHIALKLIRPEISSDQKTLQRFRHELKVARGVSHQNVCRMYDLNQAQGAYFITMEYVEGQDLKSLIRQTGRLAVPTALSIAKQICAGLSEAHKQGVVHRDLKPSNIMIDKQGNARIMDFGIALSHETKGITGRGIMIGTPDYMPPEQAAGQEVDQRSDLYSLGVICYEMVTGRLPFEGDSALSIVLQHRDQKPPDPRSINGQIPDAFAALIRKCLEKAKEKRFGSAHDILEELTRIEELLTTQEGIRTVKASVPASVKRGFHRKIFGILLGAAVTVTVGYFLLSNLKNPSQPEPGVTSQTKWKNSIAVLPFKDFSAQQDQAYFCEGMTDAIIGRLHHLGDIKVISLTSVLKFSETDLTTQQIGEELGVKTILEGNILREKDRIRLRANLIDVQDDSHLWSNSYDREVESYIDVQDEISLAIAQALDIELKLGAFVKLRAQQPKNMDTYEYYLKGMHFINSKFVLSFKEEDFRAGVDMFEKALEIDPDYLPAYFGMGWAYEHHYHLTQAKQDAEKVQEMAEIAYRLAPDSALVVAFRGYEYYEYKHDWDRAFHLFKRALDLNPNMGKVNFLAGTCYLYHGLYEQAIRLLSKSLELDPAYFWTPYKLAMCYMSTGQFEKAAEYFEKYFEVAPVAMIFPGEAIALYVKMQNFKRVEELISETEKNNPEYWGLPYVKALLLAARGEKEKALALYRNSEIFALLNMKDQAFQQLEKEIRGTAQTPFCFYLKLLNYPLYKNLEGDARFDILLKKEKVLYEELKKKYGLNLNYGPHTE